MLYEMWRDRENERVRVSVYSVCGLKSHLGTVIYRHKDMLKVCKERKLHQYFSLPPAVKFLIGDSFTKEQMLKYYEKNSIPLPDVFNEKSSIPSRPKTRSQTNVNTDSDTIDFP